MKNLKSVRFPREERSRRVYWHTLHNGLRVLLCPMSNVSEACVSVFVRSGSRFEKPSENGITHVLEHMVFRGTQKFPSAMQLNQAAESIGGHLDAATYRDMVYFSATCHYKELEKAMMIVADMIQFPRYQALEVEKEVIRQEILDSFNEKGECIDVDNLSYGLEFGTHPMGQSIEGTVDTLLSFEKGQLEAYRQRYFCARNMVLVVAGKMDPKETLNSIESDWGNLKSGKMEIPECPQQSLKKPQFKFVEHPTSQLDIRFCFRAIGPQHDDYSKLHMLNRILTDGMASRLHRELIDGLAIAYSLDAGVVGYEDFGLYQVDVTVSQEKADFACSEILKFLARTGRMRFSDEEIDRAIKRYFYGWDFIQDSPEGFSDWLGRHELFEQDWRNRNTHPALRNFTVSNLRKTAKQYLRPERLTMIAVGKLNRKDWRNVQGLVRSWCADNQ